MWENVTIVHFSEFVVTSYNFTKKTKHEGPTLNQKLTGS